MSFKGVIVFFGLEKVEGKLIWIEIINFSDDLGKGDNYFGNSSGILIWNS